MMKIAGSGSISQRHGPADPDPDPHQNAMDPQHCINVPRTLHFEYINRSQHTVRYWTDVPYRTWYRIPERNLQHSNTS
jgi:hypothetical protein